ncbi:MAG: amino acid permease [Cryobacterium sp.]|nr:amino acid permease [Oligoflexia bacterium]
MSHSLNTNVSGNDFKASLFRKKSIADIIQHSTEGDGAANGMRRTLTVVDLTALGIAAIIGAGIFSTIGQASFHGGPGVVFLFIFTAIACGFSAFCYAEFASQLPVSGSAYTYAYASLGELLAWVIGWDLLMEYAIGNIAVAISWSEYFMSLLKGYGISFPPYFATDYLTAVRGHEAVREVLSHGVAFADLATKDISSAQVTAYTAFETAPRIFGLPMIANLPALGVVILVTWVVYIGIQESKRVSNLMVLLKLFVLALVIALGAFYVKPANWTPFMPNGVSGVLKGVSGVFFAYIGFDAISTTAEECKNPQRDLPRAMMYALVICTVLYILVALVLTGMVPYTKLGVADPLAFVFGPDGAHVNWIAGVIAVSAVIALFSVLLVFQLGQPRIWMAMSRDGLLPKIFSELHPKHRTPWFSTIVTGVLVGVPCLFMNLTEVTDLTSIGTLAAFLLVCIGVLTMDPRRPGVEGQFRMPYIDSRWIFPAIVLVTVGVVYAMSPESITGFLHDFRHPEWDVLKHRLPLLAYLIGIVWLLVLSFRHRLSLIPVLGCFTTGYLMTELGWVNWTRFGVWLAVGLAIYFLYSYRHSKLALTKNTMSSAGVIFLTITSLLTFSARAGVVPERTPSGILLDSSWKRSVYDFSVKNSLHPSWGLAHSERDYQVAAELLKSEGKVVDKDVLFAAAFLHDIGGLPPFSKAGVDHAIRSVEIAKPMLEKWGFPSSKWPGVKDVILGHTYYGPKPSSDLGVAFREADVLDFMGSIGIARILAVTEEGPKPSAILEPGVEMLMRFRREFPLMLTTPAAKAMGRSRAREMDEFFLQLKRESFGGRVL